MVSLAQVSAEGDGINRPMPMEEASGCSMGQRSVGGPLTLLSVLALLLLLARRRKAGTL